MNFLASTYLLSTVQNKLSDCRTFPGIATSTSHLLIRHAQILLPNGEFLRGDVEIRDHQIVQVAAEISILEPESDTREIDAGGLTLLPGVIDPQVHFREPGLEYKEDLFTASCACARGGVTSFLEIAQYQASDNQPSGTGR